MPSSTLPVLVEIVRSGVVEGRHRGSVLALGADGEVDWAVGEVEAPILPRSANKPIQAAVMVGLGLDLTDDLLALGCASHSGEPFHVEGVRRILAGAGLAESTVRTPPGWPLEDRVALDLARAGGGPTRLHMNCSGKHAAMLATCVAQGWDTATYLETSHPLQQAIVAGFTGFPGEPTPVSVDGCGAPLLSASLTGLARAFARLATASAGPAARVAAAMRAFPQYVSGSQRDERDLHQAVPGLLGKAGTEAVYVVALPDGRAWALKVEDGSPRARPVVMAAALERSGLTTEPGVDAALVRTTGRHDLYGAGAVVGGLRAVI